MEGQNQYTSERSALMQQVGIMPKAVMYKVSKAAAKHFDASVAGIFSDQEVTEYDRLCSVVSWVDGNQSLSYNFKRSSEGIKVRITEKDEGQQKPKPSSPKHISSGFSLISDPDMRFLIGTGFSRESLEAANASLGAYAVDFCKSMANEGYSHLVTPEIVKASANYARRIGIPMELASTYAVRTIEAGQAKEPSPVFSDVHLSDIEMDETQKDDADEHEEVKAMDLDEIIEGVSSGTIRIQ